jgi:hypothetical protein
MQPACKIWLASFGLTFLPLAGQVSAQSQAAPDAVCPPGYVVFESVCLNETTGDVVNQRSAKYNASQSPLQYRPGSTVVISSCVDLATKGTEQIAVRTPQ